MTEQLKVRPATTGDVLVIFELIQALAAYEKLSDAVVGTPESLQEHLFGNRPYAEAVLAQWEEEVAGFALFFYNYSTFLTQPGIYLEDLFVLPNYRRRGIGKAMLSYLAQKGLEINAGRFEWSVLDWNESAIAFYKKVGAQILPDWRICRVSDDALHQLATQRFSSPKS